MKSRSQNIIISVLRFLNIRYTSNYIRKLLEESSDADNLFGVLTILQIYGVIVEPRKIANQSEFKSININNPFITEYNDNLLLIKKFTGNFILGCVNGKDKTYCKDEFLTNWNGLIVYIYKGESVGEPNIYQHIKSTQLELLSRAAIILSIVMIYVFRMVFFNIPYYISLFFVLSIIGAIISYQIELSTYSPNLLFSRLCSLFKYSTCNKRKGGKFRYITALGFSYFCSLCIFILLPLENYALTTYIVVTSLIEVIGSFLLQIKSKELCIQCMLIQVVVVIMILIGIPNLERLNLLEFISQGMLFLAIFTITICISVLHIWSYIENRDYYIMKCRIMDFFKKKYLDNFISTKTTSIIFLNPFCDPCKEEIMKSYNLLINHDDSKIIPIVITPYSNGEKVGKSIIAGISPNSIFHRLKEWYSWGYQNPSGFEKIYGVSTEDEIKLSGLLKNNLNVAYTYNIQNTPSIICNGIKLPNGISLIDLLTH